MSDSSTSNSTNTCGLHALTERPRLSVGADEPRSWLSWLGRICRQLCRVPVSVMQIAINCNLCSRARCELIHCQGVAQARSCPGRQTQLPCVCLFQRRLHRRINYAKMPLEEKMKLKRETLWLLLLAGHVMPTSIAMQQIWIANEIPVSSGGVARLISWRVSVRLASSPLFDWWVANSQLSLSLEILFWWQILDFIDAKRTILIV